MNDFLGTPIVIGDFVVTPKRSSRNEVELQVGIVINGNDQVVSIATSKTARAEKPFSSIVRCSLLDVPRPLREELYSVVKVVK